MTLAALVRGPHVLPLAMFFGTFSPVLLYVALSLIGLACLPLSAMRAHVPAVPR